MREVDPKTSTVAEQTSSSSSWFHGADLHRTRTARDHLSEVTDLEPDPEVIHPDLHSEQVVPLPVQQHLCPPVGLHPPALLHHNDNFLLQHQILGMHMAIAPTVPSLPGKDTKY